MCSFTEKIVFCYNKLRFYGASLYSLQCKKPLCVLPFCERDVRVGRVVVLSHVKWAPLLIGLLLKSQTIESVRTHGFLISVGRSLRLFRNGIIKGLNLKMSCLIFFSIGRIFFLIFILYNLFWISVIIVVVAVVNWVVYCGINVFCLFGTYPIYHIV